VTIRNSRESTLRREIDKLKRLLANKIVDVDFFRTALQKVEARRRNSGISGEQVSTMQFETPLQGSLSVERMCQLGQVSRAGFYRYLQARAPIEIIFGKTLWRNKRNFQTSQADAKVT
jgi:hypothetical protein